MPERQSYRLSELTLPQLRSNLPNVVVMPFAATEPHGGHLPYGTDIIETAAIADRSCELARQQGGRVVTLPTIPFGGSEKGSSREDAADCGGKLSG